MCVSVYVFFLFYLCLGLSEIFRFISIVVVYCCSWYSITSLESVLNPTANDDDDDANIVITTIMTIISLKHSLLVLLL